MNLEDFTLIPAGSLEKDPRPLAYLYTESINIVSYAKQMQEYSYYSMLKLAEDLSKQQGYILLPWNCIHWQRAKQFGSDRKIKIGRKSFFRMKVNELTKGEMRKLVHHLDELRQHAI
ncbi:hypothetical protein CHH49_18185 [Terribacillus saccharophilus]|nr:hypothetical protein CHH49_18185 [Terribacillus saccharophilus]